MDKDRFSKVFEEFKRVRFPPSGKGNKDLQDAHASLILYDADAAGVVTSLLNNPKPSEEKIHQLIDLQADYELEKTLEKLIQAYPDTDTVGKLARQYIGRYYGIRKLLDAANSYLLSLGVNIPDWRAIERYRDFTELIRPVLKSALAGERKVPTQKQSAETWMGYALYWSFDKDLTLEEVIASADAINHAIPTPYEVAYGFLRLRQRGWLLINDDSYRLTAEGRLEIDNLLRGVTYRHSFELLDKWFLAHPPPNEK